MEYEVNKKVFDFENEPIKNENKKEVTYGDVMGSFLLIVEQNETADDKYKAYGISKKLYGADKVELDIEEVAFIVAKLGRVASPMIFGRVKDFLNDK